MFRTPAVRCFRQRLTASREVIWIPLTETKDSAVFFWRCGTSYGKVELDVLAILVDAKDEATQRL
jgi:hypothetical protein